MIDQAIRACGTLIEVVQIVDVVLDVERGTHMQSVLANDIQSIPQLFGRLSNRSATRPVPNLKEVQILDADHAAFHTILPRLRTPLCVFAD